MSKINVSLDLDWLPEDGSIDEALRDEVVSNVSARLTAETQKAVDKKIEELMEGMEKSAGMRIEAYLDTVLSEKIASLKIPRKSGNWGSEITYIPITEFIGAQYERYLTEKRLDKDGNCSRYDRDCRYSISEYLIGKFFENELTPKVEKLIKEARERAEKDICGTLEMTLQKQLSADIISKINIPEMLKALQERGQLLTNSKEDKS